MAIQLVTGISCLTIPCEPASGKERNSIRPIYIGHGYICPFCGLFFFRYKPCTHHMGMVMNIPCSCNKADWWHRLSLDQQLRCTFCGPGGPKFSSFEGLRAHVNSKHPDVGKEVVKMYKSTSLQSEQEVNEPTPQYHYNDEVNELLATLEREKEEESMLPSSEGKASGTPKRPGSLEYLSNEHLSKSPTHARVLAVRVDNENKFGIRVILKLAMKGKTIFWGVNIKKNPNYQLLTDKFGHDENDWVDKQIALHLEQDEFTGTYFARVTFPDQKKK